MKQIFTLLSIAFFAITANAQFTENFENYNTLPSHCWQLITTTSITSNQVISGAASIGTDPTVMSEIKTPYLDLNGSCNVSFKYRLNNRLNNNSIRKIEVGLTDKNSNFTVAASFTLDRSVAANSVFTFSQTLSLPVSTQRFTIRVTTISGDGNSYLIIDDLSVSGATLHYSPGSCNTAPVATNADFSSPGTFAFNGSISSKASDANAGEVLTFTVINVPAGSGTLVLNPNGEFTFTPAPTFAGGQVTFTYYVTDNGYDPQRSNTATVTITYPKQIVLATHFINFSGNVNSSKAQLSWSVARNEDVNYFQLEKSRNGEDFHASALTMTNSKAGSETYRFVDADFSGTTYYRVKAVNKDASVSYSRLVLLKGTDDVKANNISILQNPVTSSIKFEYVASTSGLVVVNLYNHAGIRMSVMQVAMSKGSNTSVVNLDSRMTPGTYFMEIINGADRSTARLVKQ